MRNHGDDLTFRRLNRHSPDGLGWHPKSCSSADLWSIETRIWRWLPGARSHWTPAHRPIRAARASLADLGAWFSLGSGRPRSAPIGPPQRAVLASDRSGAGSRRTAPAGRLRPAAARCISIAGTGSFRPVPPLPVVHRIVRREPGSGLVVKAQILIQLRSHCRS
jgi:hypothetical protein